MSNAIKHIAVFRAEYSLALSGVSGMPDSIYPAMRFLPRIFLCLFVCGFSVCRAAPTLTDVQIEQLLERYLNGVAQHRFEFRAGKDEGDLERYLKTGRLDRVRHEILLAVEQSIDQEQAAEASDGWGSAGDDATAEAWGDAGWGGSFDEVISQIDRWIGEIAEAADQCNYAEAKRLADQILAEDPENEWLAENYSKIAEWAVRSEKYLEALTLADEFLNQENYDEVARHLKTALENAAANCGQDEVARTLLDQAIEAAEAERLATIAQARVEGMMHQQAIAQSRIAFEQEKVNRQKKNDGLRRGLMGLLNTAAKVNVLKSGGNLSTSDALTEVLTQQAIGANPEMAQMLGQAQQLQNTAQGGDASSLISSLMGSSGQGGDAASLMNGLLSGSSAQSGDAASMLSGLLAQQQGQLAGSGIAAGNQNPATAWGNQQTAGSGASQVKMSPQCEKLYKELERLGKEYTKLAQLYASYQGNPNVSTAQLQSTAAEVMKMYDYQKVVIDKLKAARCPGSEQIPDMPNRIR